MLSSATGTRGTFTMPDSIASISEKSDTTQGNSVPSLNPEPSQEERRGRKVIHHLDAHLGLDRLQARDPDARLLFPLLRFPALVAGECFLVRIGFAAVAMVRPRR